MTRLEPNTLDHATLRPSGALLSTQIALGHAIERCAVDGLGHDPTTVDLLVRLDLAPEQRLRAVDLCNQLLLSPSHVSRLLDRADGAGLIHRERDPADRRATLIGLTASGTDVVARFAPRLHAVLDHTIHTNLSTDEIETLVALLERIERAARTCPTREEPNP